MLDRNLVQLNALDVLGDFLLDLFGGRVVLERELALKYYPTAEEVEEEIAKDIKGVQLYEITIEHLCGKQIQEK